MVFSLPHLSFSLKEMDVGDLGCFGAGPEVPTWTALPRAEGQSQCLVVLPLMLVLGQLPSTAVLRPGNLVLYLSTK